jgi:hypothetical protein
MVQITVKKTPQNITQHTLHIGDCAKRNVKTAQKTKWKYLIVRKSNDLDLDWMELYPNLEEIKPRQ